MERWRQGKINVFDALAEMEDQRDEAIASSNERGVVVSQVSGALVDAECAVGDAREFGQLVRNLAKERDEWRTCAASFAAAELPTSKENPEWQSEQKQWAINKFRSLTGAIK